MTKSRGARAVDLEAWADRVSVDELREADTRGLRAIADLVDQRDHVEQEITAAIRAARKADRSWSEIGAMLGVSKQAAQRKYGHKLSALSAAAGRAGERRCDQVSANRGCG